MWDLLRKESLLVLVHSKPNSNTSEFNFVNQLYDGRSVDLAPNVDDYGQIINPFSYGGGRISYTERVGKKVTSFPTSQVRDEGWGSQQHTRFYVSLKLH